MFKFNDVAAAWTKCVWTLDNVKNEEDEELRAKAREVTLAAFGGRTEVKCGGKRYMLVTLPNGSTAFISENKCGGIDAMPLSLKCADSAENWSRDDRMFVLGWLHAKTLQAGCVMSNTGFTIDFA